MRLLLVLLAALLLGTAFSRPHTEDEYAQRYIAMKCAQLRDPAVPNRSSLGYDSDGEMVLSCGRGFYRAAWVRW